MALVKLCPCPRCGGRLFWNPYEKEWECVSCSRHWAGTKEGGPTNGTHAGE